MTFNFFNQPEEWYSTSHNDQMYKTSLNYNTRPLNNKNRLEISIAAVKVTFLLHHLKIL